MLGGRAYRANFDTGKKYFQGGRISRKDLGATTDRFVRSWRFWEILPDDNFVARPPEVAKIKTFRPSHMNGMCVDVTLTNMDGTDIEMPSPFDTMNERAALSCKRNSAVGRKNASYLKGSDGIGGIPSEQGRMVALL